MRYEVVNKWTGFCVAQFAVRQHALDFCKWLDADQGMPHAVEELWLSRRAG